MIAVGGILAGGRGRRMLGIDKPFARLGGQSLIGHVVARLAPQLDHLILNANERPERFAGFGLAVVADRTGDYRGPLAGIQALMAAAQEHRASHVLTVPADTPFLPQDLYKKLAAASAEQPIVPIARSRGRRHPVIALWPVSLTGLIADHLAQSDDLSMAAFLRRIGCVEVDFGAGMDPDPFFNVNSPDDLEKAERLIAGAEPGES
jgi:molybdopterin-guanine dinucleotide biosynthesis protein A